MVFETVECFVNFRSYERALELVPPEFAPAYEWFTSMEGKFIPRLPRGDDAPSLSVPIKISSQRGMHSPNYAELSSKGAGKKKYILSVYSSGGTGPSAFSESTAYQDSDLVEHRDGTWTVEYASQVAMPGKKLTDRSNEYMMNNLSDGVPVAYMTKCKGGYIIHGLAYVESYNGLTGMFTLHGPISAEAKGVSFSSEIACEDLTDEELKVLRDSDAFGGSAYYEAQIMRRKHQEVFRKRVLHAYRGRCAATNVSTTSVLQAAHIDPFAKSTSHIVTNGVLLRADVHLLYDAHLLTILPESGRIVVSDAVKDLEYRSLNGSKTNLPPTLELRPDNNLLEIHLGCYNSYQRKLGLPCA